jgi:hypothetical protein
LFGKPEIKRQLGRPRYKWEDNINMDIRGMVWDGFKWIRIGSDGRILWLNNETCVSIKAGISLISATNCFPRSILLHETIVPQIKNTNNKQTPRYGFCIICSLYET